MIHACSVCGNNFSCNGGRGTDCSCGEVLVPRIRRKCLACYNGIEPVQPPPPYQLEPPPEIQKNTYYAVKESELCRCNKCENLLGRVRFIV